MILTASLMTMKRCSVNESLDWMPTLRLVHRNCSHRCQGVKLAVFPELFIPLYPSSVWAYQAARFDGFDEMWTRLWDNSVDVPGPHIDRFIKACADHNIYCVLGVNERESARPGSP